MSEHDHSETLDFTDEQRLDVVADAGEQTWTLSILHSPDESLVGKVVRIKHDVTLGRVARRGVDLVVADGTVSRRHATLAVVSDEAAIKIQDHDSRNGTYVDGVRTSNGQLRVGSVVRIGDTVLVVDFGDHATLLQRRTSTASQSQAACELQHTISQVAVASLPVLLIGETGSGKERAARQVHAESGRCGEFVAVNCAAVPAELFEAALFGHRKGAFTGADHDSPGFFREAAGGTLFFDEVGELPSFQQPKLLRVLESYEFTPVGSTKRIRADVRIVSATNADLEAAVDAGTFRADLYARLAGFILRLPPLRHRRADIVALLHEFLHHYAPNSTFKFSPKFVETLLLHPWRMNIRELRNVAHRLAILAADEPLLKRSHLHKALQQSSIRQDTGPRPLASHDRPSQEELEAQLERYRSNISKVAKHYNRHAVQIYRWLKRYHLDPERYRHGTLPQ